MNDFQHIAVETLEGIGILTLNRPPVNVLNIAMMEEVNAALDAWEGDSDLKTVLFKAQGKCFSAGVDVGEHMGDLAPKMIAAFHGIFRRLSRLEVPTLAAVHGSCLGGGCELAVFCDLVLAAEDAKFGQPEIQVGVFPPVAAQIMPRIMGRKAAMELIVSGRIITAEEALNLGLINRVVPRERLDEATEALLKTFRSLSAVVLRLTKKAVSAGLMDAFEPSLGAIERIYLEELMQTEDANEGLQAFLDKRRPVWKNR